MVAVMGFAFILVVAGCGSSGNSVKKENALTIDSISIEGNGSALFHPGDNVTVQTVVVRNGDDGDGQVQIDYYLFDRHEVEENTSAGENPVEGVYHLGSIRLRPEEIDGAKTLLQEWVLPPEIARSGEYFITAVVDPMRWVPYNKSNPDKPKGIPEAKAFLEISVNPDADAVHFMAVEFGEREAWIDTNATTAIYRDPPFYASVHLRTDRPDRRVTFRAQMQVDGVWEDLEIWDSRTMQFAAEVSYEPDIVGMEYLFPLFINVSGNELFEKLKEEALYAHEDEARHSLRILADVGGIAKNGSAETKSQTVYHTDVGIHLYDGGHPMPTTIVGVGADLKGGHIPILGKKKYFAVGFEPKGHAGFDLVPMPGFNVSASVEIPLYIGGAYNRLVKYTLRYSKNITALADEISTNNGGQTKVYFLENLVYKEDDFGRQLDWSNEDNLTFDHTFANADFIVGPVPVTVGFGGRGVFRYQYYVRFTDRLEGNLMLHPYAAAFVRGGVGVPDASVGVEADLVIFDDTFKAPAVVEPTIISGNVVDGKVELDEIGVGIDFKAHNSVEVLTGKVGLYCDYKTVKWCTKSCCGVTSPPYPCGTKEGESHLWFYHYPHALFKDKRYLVDFNKSYMMNKQ